MMPRIASLEEIKAALSGLDVMQAMAEGFAAYSQGKAIIPPIGEILFEDPPGDVHIKYGYIKGDDVFVVKIASGFYENIKRGLPNSSGLMLLFDSKTGELATILLDGGHLTNVRTAAAGALAARLLAPAVIDNIGVLGAGLQARMQVQALEPLTDCRSVWAWGMNQDELDLYRSDMAEAGFSVRTTLDAAEVAAHCRLIVTATPSRSPLLGVRDIQPGTHITAMGSDTPEKNELDPRILAAADIVIADSRAQCRIRGEISRALKAGLLDPGRVIELGEIVLHPERGRADADQITVADLTGVAVQDIQIAKAVSANLNQE